MEFLIVISSFFAAALVAALVKQRKIIEGASVIASAIAFIESMDVAFKVASAKSFAYLSFFYVDSLGAVLMLIVCCVGFFAAAYSIQYLRQETDKKIIGFTRVRQYFILMNLFLAAMFFAVTVSSPMFAWISIEATTLSTAFLVSFYNKPSAIEAAWKYLIVNSVGLLLGFFGTLLYFTSLEATGEPGLAVWQNLMATTANFDPVIAKIAFVFVLIGYGTKVGFVPMHTWLPDAHSKAPAPISALLSGVLLNIAFIIILRFKMITDAVVEPAFSRQLLIVFGFISMLVAVFIILPQKNYKRLLAYSSIENMGMAALGFGFGGLGVFAAILHMIYHALTKSALFFSAGTILTRYSSTKIAKVRGAFSALPATCILFLTAFFVITGTPPFGVFFTKLFILSAGIKTHPALTAAMIALTALLFVGFLRHLSSMFFGEKPPDIKAGGEGLWVILPQFALIGIVVYLSFHLPSFLRTLIHDAVLRY